MAVNSGGRPAEPGPGNLQNLTEGGAGRKRTDLIFYRGRLMGLGCMVLNPSPEDPGGAPEGQPSVSSTAGTRLLTEPSTAGGSGGRVFCV